MNRTILTTLASLLCAVAASSSARASSGAPPDLGDIAGEYYVGDGLGVNRQLSLTAEGRFTHAWNGCLGRYDENAGSVELEGGILTLRPDRPPGEALGRALALRWLPVSWGERRYLLEEGEAAGFANAVNQGREPRSGAHGIFFLRAGDWQNEVEGIPALPDGPSALLLARPVEASILRLIDDRHAEIDRGAAHGLRPGIVLIADSGNDPWFDVTVSAVDGDRSVVEAEAGHALTVRHRLRSRVRP